MNTKDLLITDRQKVRDAFGKTEKDIQEEVENVRTWVMEQKHLPEVPNDNVIEGFLINNKLDLDKTKSKLDMYYTIRTLIPDFYSNKKPDLPHMQKLFSQMYYCPLPKPTKELYRVVITSLKEHEELLDINDAMACFLNFYEVRFHEDLVLGDLFVMDLSNLSIRLLFKITPSYMKNVVTVLGKVLANRVKAIHIINYPIYVNIFLLILRTALKPKLAKRIHLHKSLDAFHEHVPKEILPEDYGGDEISVNELTELWKMKFTEYKDRFDKLETLRVEESLRPLAE